MVCITDSGSPPHVFTIPPHLAFRHATVTQWCCVTGQAGHWLFVSIQINHSLFWTDNVINVQKGHGVYSSQASCGVQGGQHSKWTPLKDCVLYLIDTVGSWVTWICIPECSFYLWLIKWLAVVILSETSFFSRFSSDWASLQKVLSLFVVLIDIPRGKINLRMPCIRQGFYSLMIHVNMAHCLHFYRKAERNNTIAKIQPIWEKKNKKQHLTAQNALHPREKPQLLLHVRKRRTLGEVIAEMEMAVCMFVRVLSVFLCVCVWLRVGWGVVGKGWLERHSVKRSFRNTLPWWRWHELLIDVHFSTETRAIKLSGSH